MVQEPMPKTVRADPIWVAVLAADLVEDGPEAGAPKAEDAREEEDPVAGGPVEADVREAEDRLVAAVAHDRLGAADYEPANL